ncbi:MAG: alpha/beta hydrolase [Candidatus Aquilonibacter sp.]
MAKVVIAAAAFLLCSGVALAATVLTQADVSPYLHAQRLVDIGGRRLNIYCTGHGSPAVVLDAGAGDSTFTWRKVQPAISRFTRVCSYDRAGLGFSDGSPVPRDANAAVTDLHALLHRAGVAPPYVLVGHSEAGFYEPLYADRYPREVAGMVLVDPSFPNDEQAFDAVSPTAARMDASVAGIYHLCYEAALHGKLAQGSAAYAPCGFPPHWQAIVKAQCAQNGPAFCLLAHVQLEHILQPAFWLDSGSEITSELTSDGGQNSAEILAAQRSYGALPLIVLTAANDNGDPSPMPPREMEAVQRVSEEGHDRLAHLSSIGINFIVYHTGHDIQREHPSAVISAIAEVLDQARHNLI